MVVSLIVMVGNQLVGAGCDSRSNLPPGVGGCTMHCIEFSLRRLLDVNHWTARISRPTSSPAVRDLLHDATMHELDEQAVLPKANSGKLEMTLSTGVEDPAHT